jgi:PIN domain nuclease of toxin-antitoxin system
MVLADTQAVLRLILQPELLTAKAVNALRSGARQGGLAIAAVTLWEIALLHAKGRIRLDKPVESFLKQVEDTFVVLPLTTSIAVRGTQFSGRFPKDPADRQIAGTALVHGLTLITSDKPIRKSGEVPCIW